MPGVKQVLKDKKAYEEQMKNEKQAAMLNFIARSKAQAPICVQSDSNVFHGFMETIDEERFLDIIDNEKRKVIVHIFDSSLVSDRLATCLNSISEENQATRFVEIEGELLNLDPLSLPTLLVYDRGNLIGNFVYLKEEIGTQFDLEVVRQFLTDRNILKEEIYAK